MTINFYRHSAEDAAHPDAKGTGRNRGDGATRKCLLQKIHADYPGNSASVQCLRLLAAMRETGHVTTTEARLFLEIMNPSQRVTDLRNQGVTVDTAWTCEPSEAGRDPHRQARYVLIPNQGGAITAELAGLLVLALVAGALLVGGV